eukprot:6945539-Alexandrium_andersonii.AAC.1
MHIQAPGCILMQRQLQQPFGVDLLSCTVGPMLQHGPSALIKRKAGARLHGQGLPGDWVMQGHSARCCGH